MDWVTDQKAIDTLVALGGLRVGDEVRVQLARNILIQHRPNGAVVRVERLEFNRSHPWKNDPDGFQHDREVPVIFSDGAYVYARENIAAWRRPGVPKE